MEMEDDITNGKLLRSVSRGSSASGTVMSSNSRQPMLIDERYRNLQMRAIMHAQKQLAAKEIGQARTPSPSEANYQLSAEEAMAVATANQQHEQMQQMAAASTPISAPDQVALDRASELVQHTHEQQLLLQAHQAQAIAVQQAAAQAQLQQQNQQAHMQSLLQQIQLQQQQQALQASSHGNMLLMAGQNNGLFQLGAQNPAGGVPLVLQQPHVQPQQQLFSVQLPGGGIQLVSLGGAAGGGLAVSSAGSLLQQQPAAIQTSNGQLLLLPRVVRPNL